MTESHDRLTNDELALDAPHDALEAYALGALDERERAGFEAHLEGCSTCRDDLIAIKRSVGLLPLGLPRQTAPAGARDRLLARARAEVGGPPTMPVPTVPSADEAITVQWSAGGPPASDRPWEAGDPTVDDPSRDRDEAVTQPAVPALPPDQVWEPARPARVQPIPAAPVPAGAGRARLRPRLRLASLAWAAALAFVLSIGLIVTAWSATGPHASPGVEIGSRLPGGRILSLAGTGAPGARARLFVVGEGRQAELVVDSLPPLAPGRVYQLWFAESGQPIRTGGTFLVNQRGDAAAPVTIPAPLNLVRAVAVTEEPAPSSPQPTGVHLLDWTPI